MNEELRRDIESFVSENTEAVFRDIARLVAVDSVEGSPAPGATYGGITQTFNKAFEKR